MECKYGKDVAPWSLFKEVEARAKEEGKLPVLCLKRTGEKGFLIVTHCDDLVDVARARGPVLRATPTNT